MMTAAYTIIRNAIVLDPKEGSAAPADILVEDDRIRELGQPGLAAPEGARVIDASDRIVMPGMVNGHTHGHGNLAKGLVEDHWSLELFLNGAPGLSAGQALEDKYLTVQLGAAEMALKGCTACYDLYFEFPMPTTEGMEAAARAYQDVGIRAVLAPMVADHSFFQALPGLLDAIPSDLRPLTERFMLAPREVTVDSMRKIFAGWPSDRDKVRPAVAPTIPLHCSDAFLADCRDLADEFGLMVQTHLAEAKSQAVLGQRKYGMSLTAHLAGLGLLSERFSAAHGIWIDGDDVKRLADAGCSLVHNPLSNLRLGSGIACIRPMIAGGLNVGVGTDASCTSDSLNMYEAARLASYLSRVQTHDSRRWLSARETLAMATAGSARALGFGDSIGRLAPGFKADMVFLDAGNLNYVPLNDAMRQVAFCENGAAVKTVMVGGRIIVEDGRLVSVDHDKLRRQAQAAVERLKGANQELRRLTKQFERVVATFCIGLCREPFPLHRLASCDTDGRIDQ
jgi:5-methylthioadenosine/S-adenosylhomocysteine deaminase